MTVLSKQEEKGLIEAQIKARARELIADGNAILLIPDILKDEFSATSFYTKDITRVFKQVLKECSQSDQELAQARPENLGQHIVQTQTLYNLCLKKQDYRTALDALKYLGSMKGLDASKDTGSSQVNNTIQILQHNGKMTEKSIEDLSDDELRRLVPVPNLIESKDAKELTDG